MSFVNDIKILFSKSAPNAVVSLRIPIKTSIETWEKMHHCQPVGTPKYFDNTLVMMGYYMSLKNAAISNITEILSDLQFSYSENCTIVSFTTKPNFSAAKKAIYFSIKQINKPYIYEYYKEQCKILKIKVDKEAFMSAYFNFMNALKQLKIYIFGKCNVSKEKMNIKLKAQEIINAKLKDKIESFTIDDSAKGKEHPVSNLGEYKLFTLFKKSPAMVILYKYMITKESDVFIANGITTIEEPNKFVISEDKLKNIIKKYIKLPVESMQYLSAKSGFDPETFIDVTYDEKAIRDVFKMIM